MYTHVAAQQPIGGYCIRSSSRFGDADGGIASTSRMTRWTMLRICMTTTAC
jgi:hypothetical protein